MLAETLKKLISFQTITGEHDAVREAFAWIRNELQAVPLHIHEHEHNGFSALVITTQKTKSPALWLAGHIDVVAGSPATFTAVEKDGKLYGRGAYDMKFAIACYLELLKELGAKASDYDFGLILTSDEETGGFFGTKLLLEEDGYGGEVTLLPDGGGPWQFEEFAKGKWDVAVTTTGITAHGSRPWQGKSAVHELCAFIAQAEEALHIFEKRNNNDDHWHLTMHVGTINGGGPSRNQLAGHAQAEMDIRYTNEAERQEAEQILQNLTSAFSSVTCNTLVLEEAHGIEKTNPAVQRFAACAEKLYGISCGWTRAHGSSDARFFAHAGIPVMLITPSGGDAHSEREWVDLADLTRFYRVMRDFVLTTAYRAK